MNGGSRVVSGDREERGWGARSAETPYLVKAVSFFIAIWQLYAVEFVAFESASLALQAHGRV